MDQLQVPINQLQVTGPPGEPLITAEENSQAKWEIYAPWADLPDLFPKEQENNFSDMF